MIPIVYHTLGGFFKNGIECAVFEDFSGFLKKLAQKLNKNRFRRPVSEIFDTKKMTLLNRSESGLEFFRGSQNFWRGHPYQFRKLGSGGGVTLIKTKKETALEKHCTPRC